VRTGLSAAEAQRAILEQALPLGVETIGARDALGRVLAEAVVSRFDLPPADNSAMDGYAVRRTDLLSASAESPVRLQVVDEIPAGGQSNTRLEARQAVRIFTGAPIPAGADAVVRQEDTETEGDRVSIRVAPAPREHIRDAGEDVRRGEAVLQPGQVLGPGALGVLASLGRSVVSVHQKPRVAILSGGDELVEPDGEIEGGRIVSSNSYSLAAQCRLAGADPTYLGIARDNPDDIERHFRAGLHADVLVSSAGVSVGDRDYVRDVLEKLGCTLLFWGVNLKPGYPFAFGRFADDAGPLVFGLPGNPVSAMVTFELFVRPALRRMAGHSTLYRPLVRARLAETLRKQPGRIHFVRVELERDGEQIVARSTGNQSSGVLRSMSLAQGLLIFPAEARELVEGETVSVQVLDENFLAADSPGF